MTTSGGSAPQVEDFEVVIVKKLQSQSLSLQRIFLKLDVDQDGYLCRGDVKTSLHELYNIELTSDQLDHLMKRFAFFRRSRKEDDTSAAKEGLRYVEFLRYTQNTTSDTKSLTSSSSYGSSLGIHTEQQKQSAEEEKEFAEQRKQKQWREWQRMVSDELSSHMPDTGSGGLFLEMSQRTGRVRPANFKDWLTRHGRLGNITDEKIQKLWGHHYNPDGLDLRDFSELLVHLRLDHEPDELEEDGRTHKKKSDPFTESHETEKAKREERYKHASEPGPPRSKPLVDVSALRDDQIVRKIANQMFSRRSTMMEAFRKIDLDGSGKINSSELQQALASGFGADKDKGWGISKERAESLVAKFDRDGDGLLNKGEFVRMITASHAGDAEDEDAQTPKTVAHARAHLQKSCSNISTGDDDDLPSRVDQLDDDDIEVISKFRQVLEDEKIVASRSFRQMDSDGNRALTFTEFKRGLQNLGINVDDEHVQHIMNKFDMDKSGRLRYVEFVHILSCHF